MRYHVGQRLLELIVWREKNSRRETRILGILQFIHTTVWKTLFGKPADSLEKSREHDDECTFPLPTRTCGLTIDMVYDNAPMITKYISVPQSMSQLNCGAFLAGIIEAVLDSTMFFTERVTAHSTGDETAPQRCTILIKFQKEVVEREALLK
jgi:trafficking protein particle complex subunit 5